MRRFLGTLVMVMVLLAALVPAATSAHGTKHRGWASTSQTCLSEAVQIRRFHTGRAWRAADTAYVVQDAEHDARFLDAYATYITGCGLTGEWNSIFYDHVSPGEATYIGALLD